MLFKHNPGLKITKDELKKLFEFATSGTYFVFQGTFYKQINGVAIGSPLGTVLANLFMGYYETMWLYVFRKCEIILYRQYVDDIKCLFNLESDADKFFEFLNIQHPNIKYIFEKQFNKQILFLDVLITNDGESTADKFFEFLIIQHPNIKYTFEKQFNYQILFLDVLITNDGEQFCTSFFHKETTSGLFTNYLGFTPFSYKVGIVRTLLHRTFILTSSWFLFHEEIVKIKHY